jgi:DNA mismatch repair protein MutS
MSAESQLTLFQLADPTARQLREVLEDVEIERITPVEALLKLQELKRIAFSGKKNTTNS